MTDEEFEKEYHKRQRANQMRSLKADLSRAQTIGVGTAGCGETEIYMRGLDGTYLWKNLHPAEVVELIHQLAASNGLHLALKPREDFAAWREWRQMSEGELAHLNGWAPFAEVAHDGHNIGRGALPKGRPFQKPEQQEVPDNVAADQHENE